MDKKYKQFICNSDCKVARKIFHKGIKIYLINVFKDPISDDLCVTIGLGDWMGVSVKSFFQKHFTFICETDKPYLSYHILKITKGE